MIWDDSYLAQANPFIKSPLLALEDLSPSSLSRLLPGHYRPVQNLSMMVDYFFWNDNPTVFILPMSSFTRAAESYFFFLLRCLFQRSQSATREAGNFGKHGLSERASLGCASGSQRGD